MIPQMAPAGAAPQPQIQPAVLQALMARAQQAQGHSAMPPQQGAPQGPQLLPSATAAVPQATPPQPAAPPMGAPPSAPGMAQNLAMFGRGAHPAGNPTPMRLNTAEMAQMGRFGDSVVAHLAPGEIAIPPEIQTPQLMHAIAQAFHRVGVSPQQFMAGSPAASRNPATGANEFSVLASILPAALGIAGSMFLGPEVLAPMLGVSGALGGAIGGGLGGLAGGLISGETPQQSIMSGVGSAAGSYLGNSLGAASGATDALSASGATPAATVAGSVDPFSTAGTTLANAAPTASGSAAGAAGAGAGGFNWKSGLGAAVGGALGGALTPGNTSTASQEPAGFNNPMPPLNPNFNALLGNANASRVNFTGYNPEASVTGQPFNFYAP